MATGRKTHFQMGKRMYILHIVVYSYSLQTEVDTSGRISISDIPISIGLKKNYHCADIKQIISAPAGFQKYHFRLDAMNNPRKSIS